MGNREKDRRQMFWINNGIPIVFGGGLLLVFIALIIRLW